MEFLILFLLTITNGLFALTEIALVSVKRTRMEQLAEEGSSSAKTVLKLLENPEQFLSSIQVGITLIGIISGAYGWQAVAWYVAPLIEMIPALAPHAWPLALTISIALITYISIVIGELVPKTIAMNYSESIALFSVPILRYFMIIAYPFIALLGFSTKMILKLFGISAKNEENISEEELIGMLHSARKQGVIDQEENDVHRNLFSFADQTAKSLYTHRSQIEWIDVNDPKDEILHKTQESVHSRFLVADGSLDTVIGVMKIKDFFEHFGDKNFNLRKIVQPAIVVNETTQAFRVLNLFKKTKQYMAVVVDEYGGTSGIITLHDLIEVIVGDLPDEDEENEPPVVEREDGTYLISGSTLIYEFNQFFHEEILEDESKQFTSVAGLIVSTFQDMPTVGASIDIGKYRFEIMDMDGIKIDKILMSKIPEETPENIEE